MRAEHGQTPRRAGHSRSLEACAAVAALVAVLLHPPDAFADEPWRLLNPGVKIGYVFGDDPGLTAGVELSLVQWYDRDNAYYGGVLVALDRIRSMTRVHLGVEGGSIAGISLGPSLLFKEGAHDFGITVTAYAGGVILPYYGVTHCFGFESFAEAGSYFKLPVFLKGSFSEGGF